MSDLERYEGMLVHFSQTLTATEMFTLGRFGEVSLSAGGRLYTPTAITTPGATAIAQAGPEQPQPDHPRRRRRPAEHRPDVLSAGGCRRSNTLRSGDTLDGADRRHRRPLRRLPDPAGRPGPVHARRTRGPRRRTPSAATSRSPRSTFSTSSTETALGGGFPTARGANTQIEFNRQEAKEVSALTALDADVVGLMEIENDAPPNSAIEELVDGLNAAIGAGTYAFIDTGVIGTDEIRVAMIYKPSAVTPVGAYEILTSAIDPRFIDTKNRPSLAQTFEQNSNGAKLTVVVNHLKSKGSDCNDVGDPDTGDGQGNCNLTRTKAAEALADWLATDPTGSGDPDFLMIGDMNSYTFEDPITAFKNAGSRTSSRQFGGLAAYSYVFDGESGYLDHALASPSLAAQATGATRLAHQRGRADRARLQHRVQDGEPDQHVLRPGPVPRVRPRPGRRRPDPQRALRG